MKNFTRNPLAKLITLLTILATACSSLTGEFTRGKAVEAIGQDNRYKAPATMTIDIGWKLTNARMQAWQISAEDTAEQAAVRAKADFMLRHPQIILAEHLGYIKLHLVNPELGKSQMGTIPSDLYRQGMGTWHFKTRAEMTDKGKGLWRDLGLAENLEALPIALRDTPEITGMSEEGQTIKRADFTYKWKPTELGEAFDPNSSAFGKLPTELQDALKKTQRNITGGGSNNLADFKSQRGGIAHFKKFDDGWRLHQIYFM